VSRTPAWLVLADGTAYAGTAFGADTLGAGEVVFHTGMTGYQEILTDPSYAGQIVCMTYPEIGALRQRAAAVPSMEGRNLVDAVSCREAYAWTEGNDWRSAPAETGLRYRVVAYDFGIKRNILRQLVDAGLDVTVVPAQTSAADVLAREPDGVFLSNGPGDPAAVGYAIEAVGELVGKLPVFGICLGHQILGLALGATTRKLRFGHHGANHPAHELATGRVMIASETHGFAIDADALQNVPGVEITHVNLNDRTVEGLRHRELPAFSVQYHPEASPGPHDTAHLFARFRSMIEANRAQAS